VARAFVSDSYDWRDRLVASTQAVGEKGDATLFQERTCVPFYPPRMITNLRIDPHCCGNAHIFRIEGWEIALIVSCELKAAIEGFDDLGIIFDPVSP
jgi:hypothetical protein